MYTRHHHHNNECQKMLIKIIKWYTFLVPLFLNIHHPIYLIKGYTFYTVHLTVVWWWWSSWWYQWVYSLFSEGAVKLTGLCTALLLQQYSIKNMSFFYHPLYMSAHTFAIVKSRHLDIFLKNRILYTTYWLLTIHIHYYLTKLKCNNATTNNA